MAVEQVLSAPISPGEQVRFRTQFIKLSPFLRSAFRPTDPQNLKFKDDEKTFARLKEVLSGAGWQLTDKQASFIRSKSWVFERDGRWPLVAYTIGSTLILRLPLSDRLDSDVQFEKLFDDMAKKVLGSGARFLNSVWTIHGHIDGIQDRAEKAGFKKRDPRMPRNDSEWKHPHGWVLGINQDTATLAYDAERGL